MKTKNTIETEEQKKARENIEIIAKNISDLSKSVQIVLGGKLKRKAIVLLLAHSSGLPQYQVDNMLTALENLEKDWIK